MRPKSNATVVVVLPSSPFRSSTPLPAAVMTSSVRSGVISLTAPIKVVLPTPNPPVTMILAVRRTVPATGLTASPQRSAEIPETTQHLPENVHVRSDAAAAMRTQMTGVDQGLGQYAGDADREP